MNGYRCPLGSLHPSKPDPEQVKRDGWREQSILVVSLEDQRLDWIEKQFVKNLGGKLYGESTNGNN